MGRGANTSQQQPAPQTRPRPARPRRAAASAGPRPRRAATKPPAVQAPAPAGAQPQTVPTTGIQPPPGYVIGARDVLSVIFWRDKDMSADVSRATRRHDLAAADQRGAARKA